MSAEADVVVVDSGGANLASLGFALDRLGARSMVSADPEHIAQAPRVLLPGVGAAGSIMQRVATLGLIDTLRNLHCPVLGICLGMQILCAHSEEDDTRCLGILPGTVKRFADTVGAPVPHMGWNRLRVTHDDPLLRGVRPSDCSISCTATTSSRAFPLRSRKPTTACRLLRSCDSETSGVCNFTPSVHRRPARAY